MTSGHCHLEKDAARALLLAKRQAGKNGLLVVAGSIYLLAELFGKNEGRDKRRLAQ